MVGTSVFAVVGASDGWPLADSLVVSLVVASAAVELSIAADGVAAELEAESALPLGFESDAVGEIGLASWLRNIQ